VNEIFSKKDENVINSGKSATIRRPGAPGRQRPDDRHDIPENEREIAEKAPPLQRGRQKPEHFIKISFASR
jgi:hypothetical protein